MALGGPVMELRGIGISYGRALALDGLDLDIGAREVIGVCGATGAGKSTIARLLAGIEQPSTGSIRTNGEYIVLRSPGSALGRGIVVVHQDAALAPGFSVARNMFLGIELLRGPKPLRLLDHARMETEAAQAMARLGAGDVDVTAPVALLDAAQRQALAIARALRWSPRILVLDEPTAAMSEGQSRLVLDLIRRLRSEGVTVVLISSELDQIVAVTTRVVVLRRGRKVAEVETARLDARVLGEMVTGWVAG